jgi:hypothetical protein
MYSGFDLLTDAGNVTRKALRIPTPRHDGKLVDKPSREENTRVMDEKPS